MAASPSGAAAPRAAGAAAASTPSSRDASRRTAAAPSGSTGGRAPLSRRARIALAAILALLLGVELLSVRDKTLTYDAPDHLRYGEQILRGEAARFDDSKMPISALNALPRVAADAMRPGPVRELLASDAAARWGTMLVSLLLAGLVFAWARELYGTATGFLALAVHALDPNLLAHSRLATTDLYATFAVALVLWTTWRWSRHGGAWRLAAAAGAFGLAQLMKYTSAYLVPILLLVAALRWAGGRWRRRPARTKGHAGTAEAPGGDADGTTDVGAVRLSSPPARFAAAAAAFVAAFLLAVNLGFLFEGTFVRLDDYRFRSEPFRELQETLGPLGAVPVPVPYPYVEGLDWVLHRERTGKGYGNVYLLGETRSGEGFPGYFFVASLFKVPLATQILLAWALVSWWRRRRRFAFLDDEVFLVVPVIFFTLYFNFLFEAQMGIRFLLVVFPLLYVLAGSLLARRETEPGGQRARRRRWALGALLVWLAVSVVSYHPHYLSYMNELVGDRKDAYRILADSNLAWGENEILLERWLAAHPDAVKEPRRPTAGTIVVGTNWLTGVFKRRHDTWIRRGGLEPVDHVGYSWLVFEVSPEEKARIERELAAEAADGG